jgi:hypothetical protein
MKLSKSVVGILIFILGLIVLGITNPSSERHKEQINAKCHDLNPITGVLGGCDLFAQYALGYHDYLLFSTTKFSGDNTSTVSIGFLHMVFVIKNLDINLNMK